MDKKIEEVLSKTNATPTDYFELVNRFDLSELSIQGENDTRMSMAINEFDPIHDGYAFLQKCTSTYYRISNDDIKSVSGKMLDGMDTFMITVEMADGSLLHICIYHTDTNIKTEIRQDCAEYDVISLYEYLSKLEKYVANVKVEDSFGLELNLISATVVLQEEEEEYRYNLHITNGVGTTIDIPLVDDSCNEIFVTNGDHVDFVMVRPYGQPYMEIKITLIRSK